MKILLITVFALLCLNACKPNSCKDMSATAEESPQTSLTDEQYASIGYVVKQRGEMDQSEWDAGQFGEAAATFTHIRSTTVTKPGSHTYPRFKIIRERYVNVETAKKRLERLRDHDPSLNTKANAGLVLRRGFRIDDEVIIVTTDAVMFSRRYLDEVTTKLKKITR